MKFGVREICDVVLKAKAATKIGNKVFYKNEPVIYFDSLKTSSMEGAATTVYAQGGRGNSRLVAWEGERTVTFTMEDALISPEGFMILSGAGLIEASKKKPIYQHIIETVSSEEFEKNDDGTITVWVDKAPFLPQDKRDNYAYVMIMKGDEVISEPIIPVHDQVKGDNGYTAPSANEDGKFPIIIKDTHKCYNEYEEKGENATDYDLDKTEGSMYTIESILNADALLVDYYTEKLEGARQIEITPDKFGGNYYLEASTLFRDTNGVDMPAEFIVPNCKIQSNFTFTMASSGDPSTFTFTMDAFPDYTRFDRSKKVLAAIQIIDGAGSMDLHRHATAHEAEHDDLFI